MNMNVDVRALDAVSVDMKNLSTNIGEIVYDCFGMEGATLKTEMQNRFPLVYWLLNTRLSQSMRSISTRGMMGIHKEDGKWMMEVPRTIWSELPTSTANECCWIPFDFAKCAGNVPLNLLCLKDCDEVMDTFVDRLLRPGTIPELSSAGESLATVKRRVARLSMAFFTAQNIILGLDNVYTATLKPFHGLLSVMENDAVLALYGTSILSAFDSLGCRLAVLGDYDSTIIAVNPIIYRSIEAAVRPGQNGELPAGWSRDGGRLRFYGIPFVQDKTVPVDLTDGTGEAWVLNGEAVGAFMGTDLAPTEDFIYENSDPAAAADGCRTNCTYYYNFGTTFNNNANKLAKIVDIPIDSACATAIGDLGGLIVPQTLIPNV